MQNNNENNNEDISKLDDVANSQEEQVADDTVTISAAEYEKLKADLEESNDRGLRALAELENFRNRTSRLAAEERKYAGIDFARDIIPLWDNLGLAVNAENPKDNIKAVVSGVKMVYDEFLKVLEKHGVKKIDALHKPFDPKFHESVAFVPNDEFPANTVVFVLKAGFTLHERVVRAAQVVLAAPSEKKSSECKDEKENQ